MVMYVRMYPLEKKTKSDLDGILQYELRKERKGQLAMLSMFDSTAQERQPAVIQSLRFRTEHPNPSLAITSDVQSRSCRA